MILAALAIALSAPPTVASLEGETAPGLVMMDLEAGRGVGDDLARVLNETFLVALKEDDRLGSVVGGTDLRAMLDFAKQKNAAGCLDDACLAEVGGALGVPLLFRASLSRIGKKFVMHTKLLAVEEARVLSRGEALVASEDELLEAARKLVASTIDGMPRPSALDSLPLRPIGYGALAVGLVSAGAGKLIGSVAQNQVDGLTDANQAADVENQFALANALWLPGLGLTAIGITAILVAP